jgi:hypothetical protein
MEQEETSNPKPNNLANEENKKNRVNIAFPFLFFFPSFAHEITCRSLSKMYF